LVEAIPSCTFRDLAFSFQTSETAHVVDVRITTRGRRPAGRSAPVRKAGKAHVYSPASQSRSERKVQRATRCVSLIEALEARALLSVTISGSVKRDVTGNGLTADDTALSGASVKLYKDVNGNGTLDAADGASIATQTTGASGNFSFTGLGTGKYLLSDNAASNQVRTAPLLSNTIAINATKQNGTYGNNTFDNYVKNFDASAISGITYTINGQTFSTLAGHVHENDTVTVNFTVAAGKTVTLSLVSYHNPLNNNTLAALQQQDVFDSDTGTFGAGRHSLTIIVPDCFFQVDFVGGKVIDHFGPAGSNITYARQMRLISTVLGGVHQCEEEDHEMGRMTGGGSIFLKAGSVGGPTGTRVTHGFELHCAQPPQDVNNRLEVNWNQSQFHLLTLTSVECFDTALVQAPPKSAPIDTLVGVGEGRFSGTFNGKTYKDVRAKIQFTFTDAGEPGTSDTANYKVIVLDANMDGNANDPVTVLDTKGAVKLTNGNHQAHKEIGSLTKTTAATGVLT